MIPLYLHARQIFFAYFSCLDKDRNSNRKEEAYKATTVLLLWDPNHLTAANFRKRWIRDIALDIETGPGLQASENGNGNGKGKERVKAAVQRELLFLETLTTSPLKKHTKAPTLWAQREWLVRTFWDYAVHNNDDEREEETHSAEKDTVKRFWNEELGIVMRAGERHPRNYYAWGYARVLWRVIVEEKMRVEAKGEEEGKGLVCGTLERVKGWCLLHPRDISAWGFLMFLMQVVEGGGGEEARQEVKRIARETREWVGKYEWKGESVEWFLKGVAQLGLET